MMCSIVTLKHSYRIYSIIANRIELSRIYYNLTYFQISQVNVKYILDKEGISE